MKPKEAREKEFKSLSEKRIIHEDGEINVEFNGVMKKSKFWYYDQDIKEFIRLLKSYRSERHSKHNNMILISEHTFDKLIGSELK